MININDKIPGAPNFRYREFIKSSVAIRHEINNIPQEEYIWSNIERLAINVLQPIRNKFGRLRITSGYRTQILNMKIGGSSTSNHCRGEAADIEPLEDGIGLIDVFKFIHDKLEFRWLIAEYFLEGWIHIDFRDGANIKGIKLKDDKHNYLDVTPEYVNNIYG